MNSLWSIARFTACSAALLLTGSVAALVPLRAFDQEKKAPAQKSAESFNALRRAAEHGDAAAQNHLGHMYEDGQGVPRDYAEAIRWYRKAAEQGDADAQYNIGVLYDYGCGGPAGLVAVDNGKVVEQEDAASSCGQRVPQDYAEAVRWYRKAAEQGHAYAESNLGIMYAAGHGVPRDDAGAVRWYRRAAEQGDADAQGNLGVMYQRGRGVPRDDAEAIRWYRKAAEQGDAAAQNDLGQMYERGWGVPRDYVQGYLWMDLAVSRSSGDARRIFAAGRDSLGEKMTAQQIAESRRLAHEWEPKPVGTAPLKDR